MHEILDYLRSLDPQAREAFAARCRTSVGYLRKAVSARQQLGVELCISLDRESGGVLRCERLFPGLDWDYLREVARRDIREAEALAGKALSAMNSEARQQAQEVACG